MKNIFKQSSSIVISKVELHFSIVYSVREQEESKLKNRDKALVELLKPRKMPVQIDVINLDDELADKEITQDHGSKLDDDIPKESLRGHQGRLSIH